MGTGASAVSALRDVNMAVSADGNCKLIPLDPGSLLAIGCLFTSGNRIGIFKAEATCIHIGQLME